MRSKSLLLAAALAVSSSFLGAQRPAPADLLATHDLVAGTVQELALPVDPKAPLRLAVRLGSDCELELHPFDVRAPGFRLLAHGPDGILRLETPPSVTWRGSVVGEPDSLVAATLTAAGLKAVVRRAGDSVLWGIQPVGGATHLVYRDADGRNLPYRCGTVAPPPAGPLPGSPAPPRESMVTAADLACDADFAFFQRNGSSVTATQNDITGVMNAVDVIYQRDVMIRHQITTILVRTSAAADPYTTNDPSGLLSQFQSEWNRNQTAVQRDVAHLFTGRNLAGSVIGVAYLGVICLRGGAFGLSQSSFSANLVSRTGLTAHELGHNWGAFHCAGDPDCRIMCPFLGGCAGNLGAFGSRSIAAISAHRDTRLCLSLPPPGPVVAAVTPASVPAFLPGPVTITGSGFTISTAVQIGTATLSPGSGYTIVDNTTIRLTPPSPAALGQVPLTVTNPGGTSAAVPFTWQATSPPGLDAPVGVFGGFSAHFAFGGLPGRDWYLLVSLSSRTVPVQSFPVLRDFSILGLGGLDPAGLGALALPVPARTLTGLTFHTQVLTFDPATLALIGVSAVLPTTVYL